MSHTITPPRNGAVTLTLTWDEAEILARLIGMANHGNLTKVAPGLSDFTDEMMKYVGRNLHSEAQTYMGSIHAGQVYVVESGPVE